LIVALEFERNVVGPSLGAFDKSVVESRHEFNRLIGRGEYTRKTFSSPESPDSPRNHRIAGCFFLLVLSDPGAEFFGFLRSFRRSLPASKYARLLKIALGVPPSEGFLFD
jgi:hypothetical protein